MFALLRPALLASSLVAIVPLLTGCQPASVQAIPLAQSAQRPDLPPSNYELPIAGTILKWRDLDSGEIKEERVIEHVGRLYQSYIGTRRSFAYLPNPWADNENTSEADMEPLFPIAVGKKVNFFRRPGAGKTEDSVEVIRTETLTLDVGSVDTFVIETHSRLVAGGWSGTATIWYAPSLHAQVQIAITDTNGDHRRRQLIEIKNPS